MHDDLEIDLPSPFEAMSEYRRDESADAAAFDLDLPSPASAAALPSPVRVDLPSVPKATLPELSRSKPGLPVSARKRFGEVELLPDIDLSMKPRHPVAVPRPQLSSSDLIPDLDAPVGSAPQSPSATTEAVQADSTLGPIELRLPDLTDALPCESGPPKASEQGSRRPPELASTPPQQYGLAFGELHLNADGASRTTSKNMGEVTASASASVVRQSGGGTSFGEVSLDGGDGRDAVIGTADEGTTSSERLATTDLEFGGLPQEAAANATGKAESGTTEGKSAAIARARPGATQKAERRTSSRGARYAAIGFLVLVVLGGASLSMLPDVGLFGLSFITDRLQEPKYERILSEQVDAIQRALSSDIYSAAIRSLQNLERTQRAYPRAKSLRAYLGFVEYAVDLRFGANPERNSKAKVLLDQLLEKKGVSGLELALAARAASEGNLARAHQKIDELRRTSTKRTEAFVLSAQIEMLDRRPGQSLVYWREVESIERSARSAFGCATAEMALGQVDAAERSATTAISRQPSHVGARLLLARIAVERRGDVQSAEKIIDETLKRQSDASPTEQVTTQTLLGEINLARSRISGAEMAYTQALSYDPRSSAALRGLGEALYRAGRYAEALARYEAAVQADPDDTTAAVGVAKTQLSLERVREAAALLLKLKTSHSQSYLVNYWYGAALEAMGNRDEAEKAFTTAVGLGGGEPATIDAYISLASLKNQQGRREEAQKLLDAAREKLPASPKMLIAIGQLSVSEGRYEAAIVDFRRALELDPTDISATFRLGSALRKNRLFDEAMSRFDEVAKVDNEYPGLALERGLLYETSGHTEEALKSFENALAKAPSDADLMLRVGCGKVAAGRPKEAEVLLRKVLEQRPMSAETHHCLGRAQLLEGTNLALALRTLERAAELDPFRPEYYLYVGWAANEAGRISVAEQALKKALSLDQGLGDAYWQRGVLRFRQGAVKDAVTDLTKAIELRPNRHEAHAALAEAYYELGMEMRALEQWRIAVQAQPDNATWHFSFGKLLQAASRDVEARRELERSLELGAHQDPLPRWTWEAHRLLARSLGMQSAAIPHWQEFLRLAPLDNAYRDEAIQILAKLGQPWVPSK
jgi:tetratricopeptide (TPR) repeat protein